MKNKLYLLTVPLCTDGTEQTCFTLEEYDIENGHHRLVRTQRLSLWDATNWLNNVNENVKAGIGRLKGLAAPFKFGIEYKVYASDLDGSVTVVRAEEER